MNLSELWSYGCHMVNGDMILSDQGHSNQVTFELTKLLLTIVGQLVRS